MKTIDFEKHARGIGGVALLLGIVLCVSNALYQVFVATGDPGERFLAALPPGGWEGMLLLFGVCVAVATPLWFLYLVVLRLLRR